jgi:hypothetical protein
LVANTDGSPVVGIPALGKVRPANGSRLHLPDAFGNVGPRPALVTHLDNVFVFFCGRHQQFSFVGVVAAGLFEVDMLAGFRRQDGRWCVPVVGGGNDQRVNILVVERSPKIRLIFGRRALCFFHGGQAPTRGPRIDV